jgi:hypothetical protein
MTTPVVLTVVVEEQTIDVTTPIAPSVNVSTLNEPFTVVTVEGPPGPQGTPGTNATIQGEIPAGVQNGVNEVFTTAHVFVLGSTAVYRNGLREHLGVGYTETTTTTITFTTAPLASDVIVIDYIV